MRPSAHGIFPSTTKSSWKFIELARILTSNSPDPGLGGSSSTNLRFSKPPGALSLTSLMNLSFDPPRHPRHRSTCRPRADAHRFVASVHSPLTMGPPDPRSPRDPGRSHQRKPSFLQSTLACEASLSTEGRRGKHHP